MTPTTTTAVHAAYWHDSKDKSENVSFCIRCDATVSSIQRFEIQSDRGKFEFIVTESTADISRAQLQIVNQQHGFEFHLISSSGAFLTAPATSEPIYTDVLMDRYFRDNASHDVFFRCDDGPSDDNSKNLCDNDDRENTANRANRSILGAHRFILSQWPYFKTMFESGFEEGSSGSKNTIRVKDVKSKTLRMMFQFMYMGTLLSTDATLYENSTAADDKASWEGLYIAADRYRIDDLRKLALATIEANLDSTAAIEFLFRSAYLYPELRKPVIMYIAKEHHAEISKREVREAHETHPEFTELLGELYEAFHDLYGALQEQMKTCQDQMKTLQEQKTKICTCSKPILLRSR
ncbi:hypothetical protein BGZ93_007825 [Podila epicladia]|nr:hypothetical protein BGZ93_007825 [Podila epicladia]